MRGGVAVNEDQQAIRHVRSLYVCTGGLTKDGKYEAERSNAPILGDHYKVNSRGRMKIEHYGQKKD
ncbi:hypothetical protein C4G53_RS24035 [Vibrio parahaemolyticus]|nr:hypothetical protein [Vibrio parahaemolyticus]